MKIRKSKNRENVTKNLFGSESAVSTVIAAVLLLSIIFTLFAVVMIAYIPEWKSDAEQLHMNEVQRDMTEFKSTADIITLLQFSNSNSTPDKLSLTLPSVTIPINMGGGEVPILEPSKSSETLSLNTESCSMTIVLYNSSNLPFFSETVNCGGITLYSNNKQYVDQTFRYENGALILKQGERSIMKEDPSFIATDNNDSDNYSISIEAINISGYNNTVSSNIEASLRLNGTIMEPIYNSDSEGKDVKSFNCTITTNYPEAWKSYLSRVTKKAGLENNADFTLESISDKVYFNLTGSKNLENLYITKYVIGTEIRTGSSFD